MAAFIRIFVPGLSDSIRPGMPTIIDPIGSLCPLLVTLSVSSRLLISFRSCTSSCLGLHSRFKTRRRTGIARNIREPFAQGIRSGIRPKAFGNKSLISTRFDGTGLLSAVSSEFAEFDYCFCITRRRSHEGFNAAGQSQKDRQYGNSSCSLRKTHFQGSSGSPSNHYRA